MVALLGGSLSSDALAEEAIAGQQKIPFLVNNAAAQEITGVRCNPYTFRLQPPVPVQAAAMLPYLQSIGKRWYFLTSAYAFGQIAASLRKFNWRGSAAPRWEMIRCPWAAATLAPTFSRSAPRSQT